MDWTTLLLIKFGGGLIAMALACGVCIAIEKLISASKNALAKHHSIHCASSHRV